jgi:hypothetical protein
MSLESDYCDPDKFALSGPNYNAFLGFNAVIGLSRLTGGNIENIVLLVILHIELARFQDYALHTMSPFTFFKLEVK